MQRAKSYECPTRAMPKANQAHRNDHSLPSASITMSAPEVNIQGVVKVVAKPLGETHMPATPVLCDVSRLEGRVEVQRNINPEHARRPNGHVRVAREDRKSTTSE